MGLMKGKGSIKDTVQHVVMPLLLHFVNPHDLVYGDLSQATTGAYIFPTWSPQT